MARRIGAVDAPEARRLNELPVPRLGELALFVGILVPALAFLDINREARGLLLGAAIAATVGAIDDFPRAGVVAEARGPGDRRRGAGGVRDLRRPLQLRSWPIPTSSCRRGSASARRSSGSSR